MTTNKHTDILFGAPRSAATINAPLGQLDAAIVALEGAVNGSALPIAILTGTANSGQKVLPYTGAPGAFIVGQPIWIGDVAGTFEIGVIASIQAGVSLTVVTNLTNTYAAGKIVSGSPAELADARAGYASLTARLSATSGTSGATFPGSPAAGDLRRRTDRAGALYVYTGAAWTQVNVPAVTAFWGTPSTNDMARRTDLRETFSYDGTRWLSQTLYSLPAIDREVLQPYAASPATGPLLPMRGTLSLWVESVDISFYVNGGGTALAPGHKWVVELRPAGTFTLLATLNIDSGASNAPRSLSATVNAVVVPSTEFYFYMPVIKTGTPGTLRVLPVINSRLIAT